MATGKGSSYQPLGVRDKLKLQKAIRALRSPFHSVRVAAAKEIHKILHKTRGIKRRLHERAVKPAVRKVTPKRLHKTLGVHAKPAKAPKRQAPGPATPWRGYTPLTDRPLTKADLKERHKQQRQNGRQTAQEPQQDRREQPERTPDRKPQRDLLDDAGLRPPRGKEERKHGAVTPVQGKDPRTMGQRLVDEARAQGKHGLADQMESHGYGIPLTESQMRDLDRQEAFARAGRHDEAAKVAAKIRAERDRAIAERQATKARDAENSPERERASAGARFSPFPGSATDRPMPRGRDPRPDGAQKGVTRRSPGKAATNGHTPKERSAPAPARTAPPLPHETIRQPTRSRTR